MTEYGTIRIPREQYERHNEARKDMGLTWVEYINGEAPNGLDVDALEQAMNQISMANEPGVTIDTEEVLREVGKAVELAEQARDNTDEIKKELGR